MNAGRSVPALLVGALVIVLGACSSGATPAGSAAASASTGAASAAPSAGDPATDQLAHILARGTLRAYTTDEYPPQSVLLADAPRPADTKCQPNQLTISQVEGYDNEATKIVADGLGLEVCLVVPSWTEVTAGNWADRWDIAYGSGSINADRMTRLYMTQPYYATPNSYFVRQDSAFKVPADLDGQADRGVRQLQPGGLSQGHAGDPGRRHRQAQGRWPGPRVVRDRAARPGGGGRGQDRRLPVRRSRRSGGDRRWPQAPPARRGRVHLLPDGLRRSGAPATTPGRSSTASIRSSGRPSRMVGSRRRRSAGSAPTTRRRPWRSTSRRSDRPSRSGGQREPAMTRIHLRGPWDRSLRVRLVSYFLSCRRSPWRSSGWSSTFAPRRT